MTIKISALHYYPVKSCAGTTLSEVQIDSRGIVNDRSWMIITPEGVQLTQRDCASMALIKPEAQGDDVLGFSAPGMKDIIVEPLLEGPSREAVVWSNKCQAVDQGDEIALWLSKYLGRPSRLVRMQKDFVRPVDPNYAHSAEDQVGFADGFPFLLLSEASLQDLNSRLNRPVPMDRFRPNIVVEGCDAYAEDGWKTIKIGNVQLDCVKPCGRCVIVCIDQQTAAMEGEPLKILAEYRQQGNKAMFGQNLTHRNSGKISLGDAVEIVSTQEK